MIDSHVHFWHYDASAYPWIAPEMDALRRDRLPADMDMQRHGISGCIAVQARCDEAENAFLLDLATQHDAVLAVVGWLDFCAADIDDRLESHAHLQALCGYRHIVQDEPDPSLFLARPDFNRGIKRLQQRGITYDVLVQQKDLDAALQFCARHDKAQLVVDHLAKPVFGDREQRKHWQRAMKELAAMEHVAVKLSGILLEAGKGAGLDEVSPYWSDALEWFGTGRCLWGSDWPVSLLGHEYSELLDVWQQFAAQLSAAERMDAEEGTARRVYRLEENV
ncbi:amidohydrolase family protein [Cardiobacteriaceae bacterium TAE3-ERU3]|nr:amidohydrolase family protein [Cardiobacteriaceae bacterium TAE3-ERU3]